MRLAKRQRGTAVAAIAVCALVAGSAVAAAPPARPRAQAAKRVRVPNVLCLPQATAEAMVWRHRLVPVINDNVVTTTKSLGKDVVVIAQYPRTGVRLRRGSKMYLWTKLDGCSR